MRTPHSYRGTNRTRGLWRRHRDRCALLVATAALGLWTCREPSPPPAHPSGSVVAVDWTTPAPREIWTHVSSDEAVFAAPLAGDDPLGGWQVEDPAARAGVTPNGVRIEPSTSSLVLVRDGRFEADTIDALEVVIGAEQRVRLTLRARWAGLPTREDSVWNIPRRAIEETTVGQRSRIPLNGRRWTGTVESLRLVIRQPTAEPITLHRLAGVRAVAPTASAAPSTDRPWRVRVDDELRDGWLVPPGRPWRRTVTVPDGAILRFATALTGPVPETLKLRVSIDDGGQVTELLARRFQPGARPTSWRTHAVDLDRWAGRTVTVEVAARAPGPWAPTASLPIWAEPRIVRPGRDARPDILLISVDTWRADRMPAAPSGLTPRIDRWWRDHATFFSQALAQAPWTLPSHTSMLTGLDAVRHGVNRWTRGAPDALVTLAERLRGSGYRTMAVTGGGSLDPGYGLSQGFSRFRIWTGDRHDGMRELETHLAHTTRWLEEAEQPTFLFLHTFAVHSYPYLPDLPTLHRRVAAERSARYDEAVRRMDQRLGAYLEALEDQGRLDEAVVVITSDHGEELGEHGAFGHGSLRETLMRVPLLVARPGASETGDVVDEPVRSVDLVPTLLELAGAAGDPTLDGRSLVPLLEARRSQRTHEGSQIATFYHSSAADGLALRTARLKYHLNNDLGSVAYGTEALFDLGSDPAERVDLAQRRPAEAARMRAAARRLLDAQLPGLAITFTNDGDTPFTGTLGDLGYAEAHVKSAEPPCDCVALRGGVVHFDLDPGERFRFVLEEPGDRPLSVRARIGNATAHDLAVDPTRDHVVVLDNGGWRFHEAEVPEGSASINFERRGHLADGGVPYELDPELRARLQALGYLQ